jgi:hypothetical protein
VRHVIYILLVANLAYFSWNMLHSLPPEESAHLASHLSGNVRRLETVQERAAKGASPTQSARESGSSVPPTGGPQRHPEAHRNGSPRRESARREPDPQAERADLRQVDALTVADPPGAVAPVTKCYAFGPFRDVKDRKVVESRLNQLGFKPMERTGEGRVETRYWVYLRSMAYAKAVRITRMLDEKNDRDYLIVKGNAVSLGVFDSQARADSRMETLRKYGLKPVVGHLHRTRTAYWLDLDLPAGGGTVLETIRDEYDNVEVQESSCRRIAANTVIH